MPALAHAAPGLASKWIDPKVPLWASLISVYFLDILSIVFMPFGKNISVPLSHGLFMAVVWSVIAVLFTMLITYYNDIKKEDEISINRNFRTGLLIGFLVFSHWILDFIGWPMTVIDPTATGVPILFDRTQTIGLGVYRTWIGALVMELGMFITGLATYFYYKKREKK